MMIRSESLGRIILTLALTYTLTLGATYNGFLIPELRLFNLGLITFLIGMWLLVRSWKGWRWFHTPLDGVFVVWIIVFAISLIANLESWRRSVMGLWHVGFYIGIWYVLFDFYANRVLTIESLGITLLISGLPIIFFGFYQLYFVGIDVNDLDIPRLVSTLGNPNTLGAFMVVLLMVALGRLPDIRRVVVRYLMLIYSGCSLILLLFTFSRGTYLGGIVSLLTLLWLYSRVRGISSASRFRQWWMRKPASLRLTYAVVSALAGIIALVVGLVMVIQTFHLSIRSPGLRFSLYGHALTAFLERPITGHGLFTFGQELNRLQSQPPLSPHSHAHNAILHIAAELGIVGLMALFLTLFVFWRQIYHNWRTRRKRMPLVGGTAAIVAFATTHQFDMTSMAAAISILGIVVLIIALAPADVKPLKIRWRRMGQSFAMITLWTVLISTGFLTTIIYTDYVQTMRNVVVEENFVEGAQTLDKAIRHDPQLPLYLNQQAYLYGVAASEGNAAALQPGIDAYERYLKLEPQDTIAMINLSALYWQLGERQRAYDLASEATLMADKSWQYVFVAGNYAEAMGETHLALYHYKALTLYTNTFSLLYPEFDDTPFRHEFVARFPKPISITAPLYAIVNDEVHTQSDIDLLWRRSLFEKDVYGERTYKTIIRMMLYIHSDLAVEYEDQFDDWLSEAEELIQSSADEAWIYIGQAEIARYYKEEALAQQAYERASEIVSHDLLHADFSLGVYVATSQFLSISIPRQFLPQVNYPSIEELPLLFLLDHT